MPASLCLCLRVGRRFFTQAHEGHLDVEMAGVRVGRGEPDRVDPQQPSVGFDPAQKCVDVGEVSIQCQTGGRSPGRDRGPWPLRASGRSASVAMTGCWSITRPHQLVGVGPARGAALVRSQCLLEMLDLASGGDPLALPVDPGRRGGHLLAQGA